MSLVSLSLVVLAAFIHATWNLLSKRAANAGPTFVFAYNLFACLVYLPWMIWLLMYGDLHWNLPVFGCLLLSAAIHLAYSLCLQRGYQVYKEVCAVCHSMHLVSFRNLSQSGGPEFSEAQMKAIAEGAPAATMKA